jgi:NADP-dependent alcohol dehydrogenase
MKAVAVIKEQNIDFILAVGGGSVIDGVKFISAAVHLKGINGNSSKEMIKDLSKVIPFEQYFTCNWRDEFWSCSNY